jgi:hypothetical protein
MYFFSIDFTYINRNLAKTTFSIYKTYKRIFFFWF